jgi:transcriptional regulator with XRE-family HTH domain
MRPTITTIGRRVRALRLALPLSQSALGRQARVSPKFISEVERGAANCSIVKLLYIAEGLGCTIAQLIHDEPADGYAMLTEDQMRRMREAIAVLQEMIAPRKRVRRSKR